MSDKVILHALPPSANSAVVRTFLLAAEIPFEEKNCWGATRTPEFVAKFPNNCAPAIEVGDFTLCEGAACLRYLAQTNEKAAKFYSKDPEMMAKIDMLCDMINTGFSSFLGKAVYPTLGFPAYPGEVAAMDETKEHTEMAQKAAAEFMEQYMKSKFVDIFLAKHKFLLTDDTPTLADFRLAPMLSQAKCAFVLPDRVLQYLKDMDEVPGYAEGMKPVDGFNSKFWKVNEQDEIDC